MKIFRTWSFKKGDDKLQDIEEKSGKKKDKDKFKNIEKEFNEKYKTPLENYKKLKVNCELRPEIYKQEKIKELEISINEERATLKSLDKKPIFLTPDELKKIKGQVIDDNGLKFSTPVKIKVNGLKRSFSLKNEIKPDRTYAGKKILSGIRIENREKEVERLKNQSIDEFKRSEINRLNAEIEKIKCNIKVLIERKISYEIKENIEQGLVCDISEDIQQNNTYKSLSKNYILIDNKVSICEQKCNTEINILKNVVKCFIDFTLKILASKYYNEVQRKDLRERLNELRLDDLALEAQGDITQE